MKLGDLRIGLGLSPQALAKTLGMSDAGLAALEATPVHRATVGALIAYTAAFGARAEVAFADGRRIEVKP